MTEFDIEAYKRKRKAAGLSQKQAATALGLSQRTLQNYEDGKTSPSHPLISEMDSLYKDPAAYMAKSAQNAQGGENKDTSLTEELLTTQRELIDAKTDNIELLRENNQVIYWRESLLDGMVHLRAQEMVVLETLAEIKAFLLNENKDMIREELNHNIESHVNNLLNQLSDRGR